MTKKPPVLIPPELQQRVRRLVGSREALDVIYVALKKMGVASQTLNSGFIVCAHIINSPIYRDDYTVYLPEAKKFLDAWESIPETERTILTITELL